MPFFDFHLHPSLKAQFAAQDKKPSPWDHVHLGFRDPNLFHRIMQCQGINEVVDSQASLLQLATAGMNLVAIALHPPEAAMMNDPLIQSIADEDQTHFIDKTKVSEIGKGKMYFQLLNEELDHIEQHLQKDGKKLKILQQMSDYDPADADTIHAVLNIEGPHAFYGDRTGKSLRQIMDDVKENFRKFTDERAVRIFAMNIAHLERNDFCNHAFGIQIFKAEPFFPKDNGISNEGLELLQMMQQKNILCDIKHTSLFARKQIFQLGWHGTNWPLVCTHAGLTGIHSLNRRRYMLTKRKFGAGYLRVKHNKPNGYLAGTSFNASSINLYDDDVVAIINSGGLIGLSLDQRILGTPEDGMLSPDYFDDIYDEEIISPGEADWFQDANPEEIGDDYVLKSEDISLSRDQRRTQIFHARQFLNQVFHLFSIARQYNIADSLMAQRICIGSDFDGMINPVDCCQNVTALPFFKDLLINNFSVWEDEFEEIRHFRISDFISARDLMENIFYRNGVAFLNTYL